MFSGWVGLKRFRTSDISPGKKKSGLTLCSNFQSAIGSLTVNSPVKNKKKKNLFLRPARPFGSVQAPIFTIASYSSLYGIYKKAILFLFSNVIKIR